MIAFPAQAAEQIADNEGLWDTSALDELLAELDKQYTPYLEDTSLREIWDELQSDSRITIPEALWQMLRSLALTEIVDCGRLLTRILLLSVLALLLAVLKDSFAGGQIALLTRWAVYLLLISLALTAFSTALVSARDAVDTISDVIFVLLPLMLPLLAALGGVNSVTLLSPSLLLALNALMWLMKNIVFPLIWSFAVLKLVGQLAPRFSVSRMASLCKDAALGVMSVLTTLFVAFLGLSGITAAGRDGLLVKAAKTASGAFIPVVGRTISDTMDSVLGTLLVLKGSIGLIGALVLLLICAVPAVQMLVQALMFRIAGALVQPLGDDMLADSLSGMGNSILLLFASLTICGLFAFFALSLVVTLGSLTMMMR